MNTSETRLFLKEKISGDVLWDADILKFYSVDASSYQLIPKVIVVPKNEADVIYVVKFAKKFSKSVTVRGAGTSLVGGPLNDGIILDMRNFNTVRIMKRFAIVGPGASKGILDQKLQLHGKFFSPNPSIGRYCTIGGMLGNNASGSRSLKYGSTIDNVIELTFIDGTGKKITLPKNQKIGKKIFALAGKINKHQIPKVTKNSAGYRIDRVSTLRDTHSVVVGSEGTLGIVVSAKIRIHNIPVKRILYVVEYDSPQAAARDCNKLIKTGPSAIEFVDRQTLRNFNVKLNSTTKCLLFIEYDSDHTHVGKRIQHIITGDIFQKTSSEVNILKWWRIRDTSLYHSLKSIRIQHRIPHVIEDATVPVWHLADLFDVIDDVNQKFNTVAVTYGHAGNGNIHVRLIAGKRDPRIVKKIAAYYFRQVIRLGGSITGEHGDGLARSEFVRLQYGTHNYNIFKQLKSLLDPFNVLNPGKIISQQSTIIRNLEQFS